MSGILNTTGAVSGILGKSVLPVGVTGGSGLTALGTVTSGSIGSGVTGFTGIKEADNWRLTTAATGAQSPLSSNLERADTYGFGKLGTGMSESSGIFSFPSTGYWLIEFTVMSYLTGDNRYIGAHIYTTTNSGSNYYETAISYSFVQTTQSGSTYCNVVASGMLDVTSISEVKVKFYITMSNSSGLIGGSTNSSTTNMKFIRYGDT